MRLSLWLDGGVRPGDITILSPKRLADSVASSLSSPIAAQISAVDSRTASRWPPSSITFSTIREFKGMENRCVAVVDLEGFAASSADVAALYVAMTRAHAGLWMAVPLGRRQLINRLITEHTRRMLERGVKS
jgi:superfamily I DNA and RNA helicase